MIRINENYLKHKHLLESGSKVFIVATIDERFNQKGNYEIRVDEMYLLSEAMSKMAKSITLRMRADKVDDQLVNELANIAKINVGDCSILVHIDDPENGKILKLKTSSFKVEPRAFVHEIEKLSHLNYTINQR